MPDATEPLSPDLSRSHEQAELFRQELQTALTQIRSESQKSKIENAERYATYMRNWLAILTATVTLVLVGFGILGYTRTTDIETYRQQMSKQAGEVSQQAAIVTSAAKIATDTAGAAQKATGDLQDRVGDLEKRMDALNDRYQKADVQLASVANRASAIAQQTRYDLQTTLASPRLGLGFPMISTVTLAGRSNPSTIEGFNFGKSKGHVYINVQGSPFGSAATLQGILSVSSEMLQGVDLQPSSIKKWDDRSIQFELAPDDIAAINKIYPEFERSNTFTNSGLVGVPSVTVRVATAEGISSISTSVSWAYPQQ